MREESSSHWLNCWQLADLANLPMRTARHALSKAAQGSPVKHWPIVVRQVNGRGGRSGVRYEVALSSLPADLQRRFRELHDLPDPAFPVADTPRPIGCSYQPAPNQSERINYRYRVIQEAIDELPGTPERKAEVLRASKKWKVPVRTIYGWIKRLEDAAGDMNALARKLPSDAGQRRAWVSRRFDDAWIAAGYDPTDLPGLGDEIDHLICRAWASPAQRAGWEQVRRVAMTLFQRDLGERGVTLPPVGMYISQRKVMELQSDRRLDIRENDRKRWDDMKPRIRRDATGLAPMEVVVMDVKPLDCTVRRADGTVAWPKMIAFMDWGTHRVFRYFVLLAQGEGIRQEHVIDAFKAMIADPDWGFPQQLYRDNGTEFAMFDKIRAALALINTPGARTIINAKPYSGASKPIESKFATLDRFVFSQMRGWAGGDRMNRKTQTVGKPQAPYPGSFKEFVEEAERLIQMFETYPIKTGFFAGRSPSDWYAAKVEAGWRPVRVDPLALEAAFARREVRMVRQGAISYGGQFYRHPELIPVNGETLDIAIPYQRGSHPLINLPDFGWAALQPDMPYLPGHVDGAVESARWQTENDRAARGRRRKLAPIAPTEAIAPNVVKLPTSASVAPLIDLQMSDEAQSYAGARIEAAERQSVEMTEQERQRVMRDRQTERLKRIQNRG